MSAVPLSSWLDASEAIVAELATGTLAFEETAVVGRKDSLPRQLPGAYVPLVTAAGSLQIGVASTLEGCQALARALRDACELDPRAASVLPSTKGTLTE